MEADADLTAFLDELTQAFTAIHDGAAPVAECMVQDLLTLGYYLLGADAYGKRTEQALLSEMITYFRPAQPSMPYEYNLSVSDSFLEAELGKRASEASGALNESVIRHLATLRTLEVWTEKNGLENAKAHHFIAQFQALLTRLVSQDGQFSDAESTFLKLFDTYFARYGSAAPPASAAF